MAISRIGVVSAIDNAPLVLPTHGIGDVIVLFTAADDSSVPALTPGFIQGNSASTGSSLLPGRIQEEFKFAEGSELTIPPNATPGVARIAAIYRGLGPIQNALDSPYYGGNINVGTTYPRLVFNDEGTPAAGQWYVAFASIVMNGLTTDQTAAPAGLTRQAFLQDQQQFALYDSNGGAYPGLPLNGPNFSANRNFRLLGTTLIPLDGAYLTAKVGPVFLASTAQITDNINANLTAKVGVWMEAEGYIPEVTQASLNARIGVHLTSIAEIPQPEPEYCTPVPAPIPNGCTTVVNHAVYASGRLYDALLNALHPALRESDPMTAYDTMDDWLDRLNWQDCMGACRMPGINGTLPLEIVGECETTVADVVYADCLDKTVKHGIIAALTRLQFGKTKNLCNINEIIEPLGAVVYPTPGLEDQCPHQMTIAPLTTVLQTWQRIECNMPSPSTCLAYYTPTPADPPGLPSRIYPGLMAAECIVRSMLPQYAFVDFTRLTTVPGAIPNCSSSEM